jgi:DNA polymerase IV
VKSVSRETTFASDVQDHAELERVVTDLTADVARRLQRHLLRGRTVTLKLRDASFETHTRQVSLPAPTDDPATLLRAAHGLLAGEWRPGRRIRLVGVAVSGFGEVVQLPLPL